MMKFRFLALIAVLGFQILFFSCSKDDNTPEYQPDYLHSHVEMKDYTREQIINNISTGGEFPEEMQAIINYDVAGINLTYKTVDVNGDEVLASGALLFPKNASSALPMISFQHGTITSEDQAPSNFESDFNDLGAMYASTGFVIVMPDYLGYGASKELDHPYEHRQTLATACRDMIRAGKEYFKVKDINQPDPNLFLTGYSEGGYATMATYKMLQEEHSNEFNIKAVTAGAGAYDKSGFMDWVLSSSEDLEYINNYLWVLDSYNTIYPELQRAHSFYFNEPWASEIEASGVLAYNGESNPSILFHSDFVDGVISGTDSAFIEAIADNNCYDWEPSSPLQLYHGTNDTMVPYFNSEAAYNAMINQGATEVELIPIEDGTHISSVEEYAMGTFTFFLNQLY
ncbi:MAG: alpha/beta hydrolase family protein [Bacteroidales bacterium]